MGLKSCVGVYLIELVRLLLQYKWGTIFRSEWFWRMEEVTKRNGKGVWMREIEKCLRRFDSSLEWFVDRVNLREDELRVIEQNGEIESREKAQLIQAKRTKNIRDVIEDVEVLVDSHFFNMYSETKSSLFLKNVISHQSRIEMMFLKLWWTLNNSLRTMNVVREM